MKAIIKHITMDRLMMAVLVLSGLMAYVSLLAYEITENEAWHIVLGFSSLAGFLSLYPIFKGGIRK